MKKASILLLAGMLAMPHVALTEEPTHRPSDLERICPEDKKDTPTDNLFRSIKENNDKKAAESIRSDADLAKEEGGKLPIHEAAENVRDRALYSSLKKGLSHTVKVVAVVGGGLAVLAFGDDRAKAAVGGTVATALIGSLWWDSRFDRAFRSSYKIVKRLLKDRGRFDPYQKDLNGETALDKLNECTKWWTFIEKDKSNKVNDLRNDLL